MKMLEEIVIAGFGGQGVLTMGLIVSYAGMMENKEICWIPSYGPEMRGGTANCMMTVSDKTISSPVLSSFDTVVAFNQPSLDKFESKTKKNGILIWESTNIANGPKRTDIKAIAIPAADEAQKMENPRALNMIMLGAYIQTTGVVNFETIKKALKKVLPERHHHLLPQNEKAILRGMELAKQALS
jgi:2-oxoglutarate ferredoxin oxidoreductase subunit gamma